MADPAGLRLPGSGVFEIENLPTSRDFLRKGGLNYVTNRRRGNFRRIYAKHTLSAGDKRILSGLCREGYIAVNPCDSATNGVETKNPVIKDREKRDKKNGDPAGIRTLDHRLKRAMLYRLSYQVKHIPFEEQKGIYPLTGQISTPESKKNEKFFRSKTVSRQFPFRFVKNQS